VELALEETNMPLTTQEIADLKARVQYAQFHGFAIASGENYVEALGGGDPPEGIEKGSIAHLQLLLNGDDQSDKAPTLPPVKPSRKTWAQPKVETPPPSVKAASKHKQETVKAVEEVSVSVSEGTLTSEEAKASEETPEKP
jgi:hypothetical protein